MAKQRTGGSFAPPLSDEKITEYQVMIDSLPTDSRIKEAMQKCMDCCKKWWELPEPQGTAVRQHPVGRGMIVEMEDAHKKELWDLIPWSARSNGKGTPDELEVIGDIFDSIDPASDKVLRDAAFHLLWHVHELDLDREPLTNDLL